MGSGMECVSNVGRVITGIVRSVGGFRGGPKAGNGSTLVLLLAPWMGSDGAKALDRPLRVEIPSARPEIGRAMKLLATGTTVQIELERLEGPTRGRWLGLGRLPVRSVTVNAALETLRKAIERPVAIEDPNLGRLTLEPGPIITELNDQQAADSFKGCVRLGGRRCELSIALTHGSRANTRSARARDRRDIARAGTLVAKIDKNLQDIIDAVVRQNLPLYNETLRANRPSLEADAFRKRLEPWSISIWSEGSARLLIKTGDLFAGQVVLARLDKKGKLSETSLTEWRMPRRRHEAR
jgi:hypothetical protein